MDIAEKLAEDQRQVSVAEFFEKNKQMLGFGNRARSLVTVIKECVDNSLDATQEAGILPDIFIEIQKKNENYKVSVEDNGPGIIEEEIPKVFGKLLYGSRFEKRAQSLLPDQKILIEKDGQVELIEIGKFCDLRLKENKKRAEVSGINVPCFNKNTLRSNWREVKNVIKHQNYNKCYKVETEIGREIKTTGNHSIFSLKEGKIIQKDVSKLTPEDYIIAPKTLPNIENAKDPRGIFGSEPIFGTFSSSSSLSKYSISISEELVLLLAFFIFKGRVSSDRVEFIFQKREKKSIKKLKDTLKNCFRVDFNIKTCEEKIVIKVFSDFILEFVQDFNKRNDRKSIIGFIFALESDLQRLFIDTLSDLQKKQKNILCTENKDLALEITYVCNKLGNLTTWEKKENEYGKNIYEVNLHTKSRKKPELFKNRNSEVFYLDGSDLCLLSITNIEKIPSPEFVYDISVPGINEDENFVAGNKGPLYVKNSRGQQGIGVSAAVLYSQITTGKSAKIITKTEGGQSKLFKISIDTEKNNPKIHTNEDYMWTRTHGTRIELEIDANMRARSHIYNYLLQTSIANPHSRIRFIEPQRETVFERGTEKLPRNPREIKPHPHGIKTGELIGFIESTDCKELNEFLKKKFSRVGEKTASRIIEEFRLKLLIQKLKSELPEIYDLYNKKIFGEILRNLDSIKNETDIEKILPLRDNDRRKVDKKSLEKLLKLCNDITDENYMERILEEKDKADLLIKSMQSVDVQKPPTDCLSPIGEADLKRGLKKEFDGEFYSTTTRNAKVYRGEPFLVEVGIVYGTEKQNLLRFANRVPLVYRESSCVITRVIESINWDTYHVQSESTVPENCIVAVHLASVNVPFTRESKDAIANIPVIRKEVERAIREVARELKKHISKKNKKKKRKERRQELNTIIPKISEKIGEITGERPRTKQTASKILGDIYVRKEIDKSETSVEIKNYSESKRKLEIHAFVNKSPEYKEISNGKVKEVELDDEIDIVWDINIESQAGERIRLGATDSEILVQKGQDRDDFQINVEEIE